MEIERIDQISNPAPVPETNRPADVKPVEEIEPAVSDQSIGQRVNILT